MWQLNNWRYENVLQKSLDNEKKIEKKICGVGQRELAKILWLLATDMIIPLVT